ncbi:MAG TPA: T9SS type A sorting domain-containing protein, partial [Aquaticitalea sp.]|nr:T9SS type A sorting domain-containing protein [Aquaticitalea sp.]
LLNLTGQAPGTTIYIRVWEYFGDETEPFSISAYSPTLSIDDVADRDSFTYFPNPVKNELKLTAQSNIQNVSIFNMLGQEVLKSAPNAITSDVDMSALQTGAYFVKVTINDVVETIRVIKQ